MDRWTDGQGSIGRKDRRTTHFLSRNFLSSTDNSKFQFIKTIQSQNDNKTLSTVITRTTMTWEEDHLCIPMVVTYQNENVL